MATRYIEPLQIPSSSHRTEMDCRAAASCARWLRSALGVVLTVGALVALASSGAAVAGVTPEVSRVVFPAKSTEETLQVVNVNKYPVLVQAWVDDGDVTAVPQRSLGPVMVLPPIFRMGSGEQTNLRLINAGKELPADRESVFWLNLYEIPATPKNAPVDEQTVTVTMRTQIKVFLRPDKLPYAVHELPRCLAFSLVQADGKLALDIDNPTPYYATIAGVSVETAGASQQAEPDMLAPFSHATVSLDRLVGKVGENAKLQFTVIDDDGNPVLGERTLAVDGNGK
jgi:P pilus assembly chaperone PapD